MKSLFRIFIVIIITIVKSYSQKDSLIIKERQYLSLSTNLFKNSFTPNNLNPSPQNYTSSNILLNLSLGRFARKGNSRVLTLGVMIGINKNDFDNNSSVKESNLGLSFAYSNEKYKMILDKLGLFIGIELGTSYHKKTALGVGTSNNVVFNNQSTNNEVVIYSKSYPGIIYFINSKWAITAIIGNLSLINISHTNKQNSQDYSDNGKIVTTTDSSKSTYYSFNPSFIIANSGIGLRYFLK